jgi:hypothetical protein
MPLTDAASCQGFVPLLNRMLPFKPRRKSALSNTVRFSISGQASAAANLVDAVSGCMY